MVTAIMEGSSAICSSSNCSGATTGHQHKVASSLHPSHSVEATTPAASLGGGVRYGVNLSSSATTSNLMAAPFPRKLSSWGYDDAGQTTGGDNVAVCLVCGNGRDEAVVLRCRHVFCHGCLKTRSRLLGELHPSFSPVANSPQQPQQLQKERTLDVSLSSSSNSESSETLLQQLTTVPELEAEETWSLSCPVCGDKTPIGSTDGGLDALTSINLQGLKLDRKMSLVCEAAAQRCDVCCFRPTQRGSVDADYYCSRCAMNLCTQCKAVHEMQPVFRSHGIIHISNKDSLRLYCERHARLHCLYFCQDCQLPACCACLLIEHPSHTTAKLREALTLRRDNLKTLLNELGPLVDKSEARLKRLSQQQQLGNRQRTLSAGSLGRPISPHPFLAATRPQSPTRMAGSSNVFANGAVRHKSEAAVPPYSSKTHVLLPSKSLDCESSAHLLHYAAASLNDYGGHAPHHSSSHHHHGGSEGGSTVKESTTSFFKNFKLGLKKNHSHASMADALPLLDSGVNVNNNLLLSSHASTVNHNKHTKATSLSSSSRASKDTDVGLGGKADLGLGEIMEAAMETTARHSITVSVHSDHSDGSGIEPLPARPPSVTPSLPGAEAKPLDLYAEYFDDVRQVFQLANHMLQLSQSKRLLLLYDDVTARLQMILKTDLRTINIQLQARLDEILATSDSHQHHMQKRTSLDNSTGSLQGGHQDRSSLDGYSDSGDFEPDVMCQTMLVRPKLCWKEEKFRNEIGDLWNPCDVAFFSDGDIVVAEYDTLNEKNNRLRMIAPDGSARGTVQQGSIKPLGVAVTREGNIAITDCSDKKVKLLSRNGELITEIGKGQFGWPYGIAVNSRGQLIVTDAFNDTLSVYQPDGKRAYQLSKNFKNPYHVTVDNWDNIIVSDFGSGCLRVFDITGQKIRTISEIQKKTVQNERLMLNGTRRPSKYKLRGPRGVCTDFHGNILVADDCSRVCMFDSAGKYVRNLLTEEDLVKYPEAIATSSDGRMAVTEWNPNNMFAIKMFNLYER